MQERRGARGGKTVVQYPHNKMQKNTCFIVLMW